MVIYNNIDHKGCNISFERKYQKDILLLTVLMLYCYLCWLPDASCVCVQFVLFNIFDTLFKKMIQTLYKHNCIVYIHGSNAFVGILHPTKTPLYLVLFKYNCNC